MFYVCGNVYSSLTSQVSKDIWSAMSTVKVAAFFANGIYHTKLEQHHLTSDIHSWSRFGTVKEIFFERHDCSPPYLLFVTTYAFVVQNKFQMFESLRPEV